MDKRALFWSAFERIGQQTSQLIVTIVLARLISPTEFGLVAILLFFVSFANIIIDSGFGTALIRLPHSSQDHETTVLYSNTVLGILSAILLFSLSPLLSSLYKKPELELLLQVIAIQPFFYSIGVVQNSLLIREMRFKRQSIVSIGSTIISGIVGIILALRGYGAWSLVIQSVSRAAVNSVLLWLVGGWRPKGKFKIEIIRQIFPFSINLLISNAVSVSFENIYSLIIGKVFSIRQAGLFTRAQQLQQYPSGFATAVIGKVSLPTFAALQNDKKELNTQFEKEISYISAIFIPFMFLISASGKTLITIILGNSWISVAPYFSIMCFAGMLYPIHAMNLNVQMAIGKSRYQLISEIIKRSITVAIIYITFKFNLYVVSSGYLFVSLISLLINGYFTCTAIGCQIRTQLAYICKYILFSVPPCILIFIIDARLEIGSFIKLAILFAVYLIIYVIIVFLFRDETTKNIITRSIIRIRRACVKENKISR